MSNKTEEARPTFEGDEAEVRASLELMSGIQPGSLGKTILALLDAKDARIDRLIHKHGSRVRERDAALSRAEQAEAALAEERKAHQAFRERVSDRHIDAWGSAQNVPDKFLEFILPAKPADPRRGEVWTYKGKEYFILNVDEKCLTQHDDGWHPTIAYRCEPDNKLTFCRALPDFLAKFTPAAIERAGGVKAVFGEGV